MKTAIKSYSEHFRIFSIYLKVDYPVCERRMKIFFQTFTDSGSKINSDKKIEAWFDGSQKPQLSGKVKQVDRINLFFQELAKDRGVKWEAHWLIFSIEDLAQEELLYAAVRKYKQPYAIARFHKDYAKNLGVLDNVTKKYCHQCFYIYRIHSLSKLLVRDVLVIHGHDEEKIFCNLYQYTDHYMEKPKYPELKNIERYSGNLMFNHSSLIMHFASPDFDIEHGADFTQVVMPRFHAHKERMGLMMSLTDEYYNPIAVAILVQKANIEKILPTDMNNYVGKVKNDTKKDKEIYKKISDKLLNKFVEIEQSRGDRFLTIPLTIPL